MKNKFPFITIVVFAVMALTGCQNAPQKNIVTNQKNAVTDIVATAASKCAPMHNLSQKKRKACTGQVLIGQGERASASDSPDTRAQKKS